MDELRLAIAVTFVVSGAACAIAGVRAWRRLSAPDVRRGLVALFVITTSWAWLEGARLLVDLRPMVAHVGYLGGLVVGLAAVAAWLYFCSAYAGLSYHRDRRVLGAGAGVYLFVTSLKLTNPLHGQYYTVTITETPFRHLAVNPGTLHWLVVGGVYVLLALSFVALASAFREARANTTALWVLSAVAAVPVVPQIIRALQTGMLLGLNYEPVGVAVFAVGVLYVVDDTFVAVGAMARQQVVDEMESAVVVVDEERTLLDFNDAAADLFPETAAGRSLRDCCRTLDEEVGECVDHDSATGDGDGVATAAGSGAGTPSADSERADAEVDVSVDVDERPVLADLDGGRVLTLTHDRRPRHYLLRVVDVDLGARTLGHGIVLSEVTDLEEERRKLRRQNEQLDDFAAGITHELRNPLAVIQGYVERLGKATDGEIDETAVDSATAEIAAATGRMDTAVDELNVLARRGRPVEEMTPGRLDAVVDAACDVVDTTVETVVGTDGVVVADRSRLRLILVNLLTYADEEGADRMTADVRERAFIVELSGEFDIDETRRLLRYGYASGQGDTRLSLANAQALCRAHGWSVDIEYATGDGPGPVAFLFSHVDATPGVPEATASTTDSQQRPTTDDFDVDERRRRRRGSAAGAGE